MCKLVIATLVVTALSFVIPPRSQAQANTLGYGIDLSDATLDKLRVRVEVSCNLFVFTADGTRVRNPGCEPPRDTTHAAVDSSVTIATGVRHKYAGLRECARSSVTCKLPLPHNVRAALAQLEGGKAGIYVDEKEPERLHVNFRRFDYECEGASVQTDADALDKPLANLAGSHPVRCGSTAATLEAQRYALDLKNNERVTFTTSFWYATGLTIPLRYWLPYGEGRTRVHGRATGALNGSVMLGYRAGWTDYKFVRHGEREPEPIVHVGVGPFLGLSLLSIGEATTTRADSTTTPQAGTTIALSGGIGALVTIRDFTVGVFLGWDHGFSALADRWDFHHRPWIGVGLSTDQLAKVLGVK